MIKNIHHIHVWSLDGVNNYMTLHVELNEDINKDDLIKLKQDIKKELNKTGINHVTLEFDYFGEKCIKEKF